MGRKKMVTVAASVPAWAKARLELLAKKKKMSVRRLAGEILVKALLVAPEEPGLEKAWATVRKMRLKQQIATCLRGPVPPPSQQDETIRSSGRSAAAATPSALRSAFSGRTLRTRTIRAAGLSRGLFVRLRQLLPPLRP